MTDQTDLLVLLFLLMALVANGFCECRIKPWEEFTNTAIQQHYGGQQCDDPAEFVTSFAINSMECCTAPAPWQNARTITRYMPITETDKRSECPPGYFVQGFLNELYFWKLYTIPRSYRCSKPIHHPDRYRQCYTERDRQTKCIESYFFTGLTSSGAMKCCQMVESPEVPDTEDLVKKWVMEDTLADLSELADNLGFAYSRGCTFSTVGEGFYRDGDSWRAFYDKEACVDGHEGPYRLRINYKHWKFVRKAVEQGEPVYQNLEPELVDSGIIYNNDKTEATKEIHRSETVTQTVSHTVTGSWKKGRDMSVSLTLGSSVTAEGGLAGVGSVSATVSSTIQNAYSFKYETSQSTKDVTGKEQKKTLTVKQSKNVAPHSSAKWRMVLTKGRMTIPYTTTYVMIFDTEFSGLLKPNNRYKLSHTKYIQRRKYGEKRIHFHHCLSSYFQDIPLNWEWLYDKDAKIKQLIQKLCDATRYEVKLTGKFEVDSGRSIAVYWDGASENGSARSTTGLLLALKRSLPILWLPLIFCISTFISLWIF